MKLTTDEIVFLIVCLCLNQAMLSLLRVRIFSTAVSPFYLSFDPALHDLL